MKTQTFRFSGVEKLAALLVIGGILFLAPTICRAGVNTWTGGSPVGLGAPMAFIAHPTRAIATDPFDPHVLYAAYDSDLYRSGDGGRSWTRIGSFYYIGSLFVHPTFPSTLYLGALETNLSRAGVLKSEDGGVTWNQTLLESLHHVFVRAFAASPRSPSTLRAGAESGVYKSLDGGNHWEWNSPIVQNIAALVIDPQNDATLYAGGDDLDYPGYPPIPFFSKSTDGGGTWNNLSTAFGDSAKIEAIAIDPTNSSTLFVGLSNGVLQGVYRSEDGGLSWAPLGTGLPANVFSLATDPRDPHTLYAGTDTGVYRTRDAGASWIRYGQQLGGVSVRSLAFDASGRTLHAGTDLGAFDLEAGAGALDVSSGAADQNRVLFWDSDRLSVRTLDESGNWTSTPFEGPFSGWTATAIADGTDGLSRVLWQSGDGRVALEVVGPSGSQAAFRFGSELGWSAIDLSVGPDGRPHMLWTSAAGQMRVVSVDPSGVQTSSQTYGPYGGWAARAIADGPDGATWVLWHRTDGAAGILRSRAGVIDEVFRWDAIPGWTVEDLAVAADGLPRILWTNPDGRMAIWSVDTQGQLAAGKAYSSAGLEARRIAASSDGLTRVLWTGPDGSGAIWLFNSDNSLHSQHLTPIPAPPATSAGDLAGAWAGTFDSVDFIDCNPNVFAQASFEQQGSVVDGVLNADVNGCGFVNATFHGTLHGNLLEGTISGGGFRYRFEPGSTAMGTRSGTTLELRLKNNSLHPLPIPGGTMHLHR